MPNRFYKASGDKWAGLLNNSDFESPEVKANKKINDLKENKSKNINKGKKKTEKTKFESKHPF